MTGRYALLAAALLAPGLFASPDAHAQSQWRYQRAASFPLTGADSVQVRPFLAATSADGSLYVISSRATDTLAHNSLWKLAPGATELTLVQSLFSDPNVGSVRGITTIGNDVLVSTNQKPPTQTGAIYYYTGGSAASRLVFSSGGYGTYPYGLAATSAGHVFSVVTNQTSSRVYNFVAGTPGYGSWIAQNPVSDTHNDGHDACALSQLRDVAVVPGQDYTTTGPAFFTTRNATPGSAPVTCTKYAGSVTIWTGGTAAQWLNYTPETLVAPDGSTTLSSYVAAGITADRAGSLYLAGPDSARRFVKNFSVAGTFAFEDASKRFPSATTNVPGERDAAGAPFRAPVDVALTADEKFGFVIDRDARKVFVFANANTVGIEEDIEASGLSLAAPGPNPVRGATTLRFALRESGPARLAVYDALGREVARLVDATTAAGEHSVIFDASALPAGLYLVRLDANGASTSETLVRIR